MFEKIVAVDETLLTGAYERELCKWGKEVVVYHDFPSEVEEVKRRIGDADCLLVSFRTPVGKEVMDACRNLKYIGMYCSVYDPRSCNVDLQEAERRGIAVKGVRDYGDEGVVEYVISELVRLLHGFGGRRWKEQPTELTGQKVGIVGLGKTGGMVADAFRLFGASVSYCSRSRKPDGDAKGYAYKPLHILLKECDIVCTCLPRNTFLLGKEEFALFGNRKILVNTSVGPTFQVGALEEWLHENPQSWYLCDATAMGNLADRLSGIENVLYTPYISGKSEQSVERLNRKALQNLLDFLSGGK